MDAGGDKGKGKEWADTYVPGLSDKFRENRGPYFHTYTPLNVERWMKR